MSVVNGAEVVLEILASTERRQNLLGTGRPIAQRGVYESGLPTRYLNTPFAAAGRLPAA